MYLHMYKCKHSNLHLRQQLCAFALQMHGVYGQLQIG